MNTEIYYFTGTGNSLHVAKELQKKLPDSKLIPIASLVKERLDIKDKESKISTNAQIIGIVFPCHGLTVPVPVIRFLKLLKIKTNPYIFAVVTRGGSIFRGFLSINKLLKKKSKKLDASFVINMPMNDPKLQAFDVPTMEELQAFHIQTENKIIKIQQYITEGVRHHDDINGVTFSKSKILNAVLERLVPFVTHKYAPKVKKYFYQDDKCTGCGTCAKVCPAEKIIMENGKPLWQKTIDCYLCYGCLNYCPSEAVQIYSKIYMKSYTTMKGRYPHPYARVKDIAQQKIVEV